MDMQHLLREFPISSLISFSGVAAAIILAIHSFVGGSSPPKKTSSFSGWLFYYLLGFNRIAILYLLSTILAFIYAGGIITSNIILSFTYGSWFTATLMLLVSCIIYSNIVKKEAFLTTRYR